MEKREKWKHDRAHESLEDFLHQCEQLEAFLSSVLALVVLGDDIVISKIINMFLGKAP